LSAVKMASNLKGLTPLNAKKLIGSWKYPLTAKTTVTPIATVNKYQMINEKKIYKRTEVAQNYNFLRKIKFMK
jgi:hypothetical protein